MGPILAGGRVTSVLTFSGHPYAFFWISVAARKVLLNSSLLRWRQLLSVDIYQKLIAFSSSLLFMRSVIVVSPAIDYLLKE